ncbi:glycoside hydrolase family 3 N-terminal domain-containing protein [Amphiplicatus metriothermophilus]|uniref:Beta-D-glucoside glucohydrolase n=1 Tax=Amphiplicatus metriothermophilus TaxID=1519374 RepID=A0A239PVU3_9PROT|nr:glycoside hydrolase family 3 N-terminal domain-containing protein [Amphiplicatus metriothermophilus]MBB5519499.1 beta-glucosidase-like glycosyl hydrolase/sugar lactone lactonase YvrE [Amphiplicatus metriothermophilus]SNT74066.1 beta-glucosidase [Amphiplicatus metriothermophilus]
MGKTGDAPAGPPARGRSWAAGFARLICALVVAQAFVFHHVARAAPSDSALQALVERMTLREKLGQLNQIAGGRSKALNSRIDEAELERIRRGEAGSYLHVAGAEFLKDLQKAAVEDSPHGVPLLFAMDVVHGYRTIFPAPIAMASSFDPEIVRKAARVAAVEASAAGLHWTFAPMIDIARDPRWGRIVEGAGADPYLGSVMAAAQVEGYQNGDLAAPDTIMATAKHFGAYGAAEGGRDYDSADISARTLHEVYLPPFYAAAKAGAGAMMTAFNDIAGAPTTANRALVRDLLKGEWGFEGVVVSDWNAVAELIEHGVAPDRPAAGALALDAGVDVDMMSGVFADDLEEAIRRDPALASRLDEAVLRVLKAKRALGLFDRPYQYHDGAREQVFLSAEHRAVAREAARKSIVLLKNEGGLLPLTDGFSRVAVVGALAEDALSQLASWRAQGDPSDVIDFVQALRDRLANAKIEYEPGADARTIDRDGVRKAVRAARRADLVILVVGEDYDLSGEARSRSSVELPAPQQELADAVLALDKPTVVILANGRPLAVESVVERADAVLESWFLGVEAGPALVDILTGAPPPGGKLPAAFPRRTGQTPVIYDHRNTGRPADPDPGKDTTRYLDLPITPLFPFGHGLSYAPFDYSGLEVSKRSIGARDEVEVRFTLSNAGAHVAEEVAQLYIRDPVASVARPVKQLRGFRRVRLAPGEAAQIVFTLAPAQFAFYDDEGRWTVEPGAVELMIGSSSADIRLRETIEITETAHFATPAPAIATRVETRTTGGEAGRVRRLAPEIDALVPPGAKLEILGSGFQWAEGPVWIEEERALYFTDVPKNRMYRWTAERGVELFLEPSGGAGEDASAMREPGANGLARDPERSSALLLGDHGARAITRLDRKTLRREIVVGRFEGARFNSPNDLVVAKDGVIYFTDPPYGLRGLNAAPEKELAVNGVYALHPDGRLERIIDALTFPNGVALSPDESTLYVSNSDPDHPVIMAYDRAPDGGIANSRVFFDARALQGEDAPGLPDGMAVAPGGALFATGPGGVLVLSPEGALLGVVETGLPIANCALDGDGAYLYLTSQSLLARIAVNAR